MKVSSRAICPVCAVVCTALLVGMLDVFKIRYRHRHRHRGLRCVNCRAFARAQSGVSGCGCCGGVWQKILDFGPPRSVPRADTAPRKLRWARTVLAVALPVHARRSTKRGREHGVSLVVAGADATLAL
eukprot:2848787-Rhodomonas_salina.1